MTTTKGSPCRKQAGGNLTVCSDHLHWAEVREFKAAMATRPDLVGLETLDERDTIRMAIRRDLWSRYAK